MRSQHAREHLTEPSHVVKNAFILHSLHATCLSDVLYSCVFAWNQGNACMPLAATFEIQAVCFKNIPLSSLIKPTLACHARILDDCLRKA